MTEGKILRSYFLVYKKMFAFIEIFDDKDQVFGGWMTRNEPGQNPLQHSDYDVWLVKCN